MKLLAVLTVALFIAKTTLQAGSVEETKVTNPPPDVALNTFAHFEVKKITMDAPYAGQSANEKARVKIQENFDQRVNPLIAAWNAKATSTDGKTLSIEPHIEQIKFINGTARFWAGAFAGDSGVILKIQLIDKQSGKVIADPEFFQRANKHGGAWTIGATDNNMLVRIAQISAKYISANYDQPVGGPTGVESKK